MMESLTESEISQIARHQRDAGVQRLSRHFSWLELSDERRLFHQEFVFDVAMFAASRGFSWTDVIRAAEIAKGLFPRLGGKSKNRASPGGLDVPNLLSLLRDELSEYLPNLTPLHQQDFTQFLTHTLTARRRLFQAAVSGASNMSIAQLHLEVQVPPTPCPLAQALVGAAVRATEGQMLESLD
ncbi:uncharacterized protein C8orf74 homolog isoform X1 [Notothenia coriiceps]|uniref:Uncharacterized protein C8orf74 homolog isoform X1 n=1 Tax=Notothenia coriiceps TaxID=8208 RepID=A0A6I9NWI2_9TELE|nr:PREDICTED: uncharacterized protein C8orf74 homolog isoform X1 [Notothenia coriiceps]